MELWPNDHFPRRDVWVESMDHFLCVGSLTTIGFKLVVLEPPKVFWVEQNLLLAPKISSEISGSISIVVCFIYNLFEIQRFNVYSYMILLLTTKTLSDLIGGTQLGMEQDFVLAYEILSGRCESNSFIVLNDHFLVSSGFSGFSIIQIIEGSSIFSFKFKLDFWLRAKYKSSFKSSPRVSRESSSAGISWMFVKVFSIGEV